MNEISDNERWTPAKLHKRIFILEVVTFLSLVLNMALWYFAGNINSKVEDRTTPTAVETSNSR